MSARSASRSMLVPLLTLQVMLRVSPAIADDGTPAKRGVLVELYTSQGCDMCPAAEAILGRLAADEPGILPVAFQVDHFNHPWKDVFADPLYSRRQMTYNEVYSGLKPASHGLNDTPMMMIDGERSVNGRDAAAAVKAIRAARAWSPAETLDVTLDVAAVALSGKRPRASEIRKGRAE